MTRFLAQNLGYKLLSFGLTALLWVVAAQQQTTRVLAVPLDTFGPEPDVRVTSNLPTKVDVELTGSWWVISRVSESDINAVLDLTRVKAGRQVVKVNVAMRSDLALEAQARPKITEVEVVGAYRDVRLELVRVAIIPSPPSDFAYSSVAVEPQTVSVAGPSDVLRRAKTVRVLLELTEREMAKLGREKSSVFQLNPVVLDADGHQLQGVQVDPASVTVRVSVSEQQSEKQVLISPQLRGQALAGYRLAAIECNPLTTVLVGSATVLSRVSSVETEPIDVSGLSADKDFEAHLRVPEGVALRGRPTARIRVRVERL